MYRPTKLDVTVHSTSKNRFLI